MHKTCFLAWIYKLKLTVYGCSLLAWFTISLENPNWELNEKKSRIFFFRSMIQFSDEFNFLMNVIIIFSTDNYPYISLFQLILTITVNGAKKSWFVWVSFLILLYCWRMILNAKTVAMFFSVKLWYIGKLYISHFVIQKHIFQSFVNSKPLGFKL